MTIQSRGCGSMHGSAQAGLGSMPFFLRWVSSFAMNPEAHKMLSSAGTFCGNAGRDAEERRERR